MHEWVPLGLTASHFLLQRRTQNARADGCVVQTKGISPMNTALLSRVLQMVHQKEVLMVALSPLSQSLLHQNA